MCWAITKHINDFFCFQAVQDVEHLLGAREIALKHPQKFLKKFNEQMSQLPVSQDIPNVPTIDWDKYKIPSVSHVVQKPETRYKGKIMPRWKIHGSLEQEFVWKKKSFMLEIFRGIKSEVLFKDSYSSCSFFYIWQRF